MTLLSSDSKLEIIDSDLREKDENLIPTLKAAVGLSPVKVLET